jgi:AraC-like DNA-binding protein
LPASWCPNRSTGASGWCTTSSRWPSSSIWRRREGDLVEARRALRTPVILIIGGYALIDSIFEIAWALGGDNHWLSPLQGASLALVSLLTAAAFLQARPELFVAARPAPQPDAVDPQDRPALARLQALMDECAWRREGLTIGQLAADVGVPEHRLRRLINSGLGHRNFADFIGAHRIAAAKVALADPANARASISALAFDLGYASLGPFNRALRTRPARRPASGGFRRLVTSLRNPFSRLPGEGGPEGVG